MSFWEKWEEKVKSLEKEIQSLKTDYTYDIDEDHHKERASILKNKQNELDQLMAEAIPY